MILCLSSYALLSSPLLSPPLLSYALPPPISLLSSPLSNVVSIVGSSSLPVLLLSLGQTVAHAYFMHMCISDANMAYIYSASQLTPLT